MHTHLADRPVRTLARMWVALAAFLFLAGAAPGADPPTLDEILNHAARHADLFVQQFSDVKCTERVQQAKLGRNGKEEFKAESVFDFLLILQAQGGEILLEESRLATVEGRPRNVPLMVTNGFSTLLLVFHPVYQSTFEFARLEDDRPEDASQVRIRFRHIRGTRSPAVLLLRGREFPLDLEGVAWLDAQTGAVTKMDVTLAAAMDDIGLRSFRGEVDYSPVSFSTAARTFWLPATATIDVETPRQHWRNVHRFTDYKLFSVSATMKVGEKP